MLKHILFFIGMFTNPLFPDMGSQFALSVIIGSFIPKTIVSPVHCFLLKIPLIGWWISWFEEKIEEKEKISIPLTDREISIERLKTAFPRIVVGYLITYIIGGFCLVLYFLIF